MIGKIISRNIFCKLVRESSSQSETKTYGTETIKKQNECNTNEDNLSEGEIKCQALRDCCSLGTPEEKTLTSWNIHGIFDLNWVKSDCFLAEHV